MYKKYFKGRFDFFIALLIFILILPVFIVITILLYFSNNNNPFFFQVRPGKNAKLFTIIKFKTMSDKKDSKGVLLPDEQRLTFLGTIIRKTSLDEIPQLLNVIKGDMSLVGPRPLLTEYLNLYSLEQTRRHEVRPGITGWAQINGRNAISWQKKFEYDIWYVDHISLGLDLKITMLTMLKVFKGKDINQNGQATAEKFKGNI